MGNAKAIASKKLTPERAPFALEVWVVSCASLGTLGWVLSFLGHLDAQGYAVGITLLLCLLGWLGYQFNYKDLHVGHVCSDGFESLFHWLT